MTTTDASSALVACDVEGTLTTTATWEGLRAYLLAHGGRDAYRRFLLRRLPGVIAYRLGIGDQRAFKEAWILGLLTLFAGFTVEEFKAAATHAAVNFLWPGRRTAVVTALERQLEAGATGVLASGVFQPVLEELVTHMSAQGIGPLHALGTPLEIDNGHLTGRLALPLNVGMQKAEQLQAWADGRPLTAAYGDTAGDIPMLRLSAHPVAVFPDDALRATAKREGWKIVDDA